MSATKHPFRTYPIKIVIASMQGISCVFKYMTTNHRAAWKTGGLAWPKLQFCGNVKTRKFVIATHSTKVFELKLLKSLDGVSYQEKNLLRQNNLNKQSIVHEIQILVASLNPPDAPL